MVRSDRVCRINVWHIPSATSTRRNAVLLRAPHPDRLFAMLIEPSCYESIEDFLLLSNQNLLANIVKVRYVDIRFHMCVCLHCVDYRRREQ